MKTLTLSLLSITFALGLAACGGDSDDGANRTNAEVLNDMITWICERAGSCNKAATAADVATCKKVAIDNVNAEIPASKRNAINSCNATELNECKIAISVSTCATIIDEDAPLPTQCARCDVN